ncbi:MAG: hypothetical protein DWQ31_17845 [Planctomycetota bacterium]|nr:MAG: hypothetical protein DWQ31_17845 [Planctomycetota bacterium]
MKHGIIASLLLCAVVVPGCQDARQSQDAVPAIALAKTAAVTDKAKIETAEVVYSKQGDVESTGFLARPSEDGNYPGIVLIHEWWGLNDHIRQEARRFAELGYVALAVDLYAGEATTEPERARELATAVRDDMAKAQQNLRDALDHLKGTGFVDPERLASIGWCFGGGWSYQIARNNLGVKASVIFYGRFNPEDDLAQMRAKIIGHFAEEDRAIKVDNVREFQAKLKTQSGDHEIYIYPNTTHGFASREGDNPGYDKEAAELAWERTLAFLKEHLQLDAAAAAREVTDLVLVNFGPLADGDMTLLVFTRTDCPIANRYAPEIRRVYEAFDTLQDNFYLVYVDPAETAEQIQEHLEEYNLPGKVIRDPGHRLVEKTGARVTPEAALFAAGGKMVYRGRIDDQYVDFGKTRAAPTQRDLREAIGKLLDVSQDEGHDADDIELVTTKAIGCYITDLKPVASE